MNKKLVHLVLCGIFLFSGRVLASPDLAGVASGNVSVSQQSNVTTVNQSSARAIINWNSFNIQQNETTNFQQPAGGIALNRINPSAGVSQIYGHLNATGEIILINQAGLYFGPSAYVNVGALIASTADISNQNFMAGNYQFNQAGSYSGSVINEGHISSLEHGFVVLQGHGVVNNGTIKAQWGQVVLGAGESFVVSFDDNNLINFVVATPTQAAGVDQNGNSLSDGVDNNGIIEARGGTVQVAVGAAQGVLNNAINMAGQTEVSAVREDGRGGVNLVNKNTAEAKVIELDGGSGSVVVSGKLEAVGGKGQGGRIEVTGSSVNVQQNALIDASGDENGGIIELGGAAPGASMTTIANSVTIDTGAQIRANSKVRVGMG